MSAPALQNYERGRWPKVDELLRIAQGTGKSVTWLLTGRDDQDKLQAGVVKESEITRGRLEREDRELLLDIEDILLGDDNELRDDLRRFVNLLKKTYSRPTPRRREPAARGKPRRVGYLPTEED